MKFTGTHSLPSGIMAKRRFRTRERIQKGSIIQIGTSFYVRYWCDGTKKDGPPGRVQRSEFLCEKDAQHHRADCKAVKLLCDEVMLHINSPRKTVSADITVEKFWEAVYLPWAREINPRVGESNLRPSTIAGYEQIWEQH